MQSQEKLPEFLTEATDNSFDPIDLVANANCPSLEHEDYLPGIQSKACTLHGRRHLLRRQQELLYTTNCHGGKVVTSFPTIVITKPRRAKPGSDNPGLPARMSKHSLPPLEKGVAVLKDSCEDINIRFTKKPKLPQEIDSKDLVRMWLKHGCVPLGEKSFFPNIMHSGAGLGTNDTNSVSHHRGQSPHNK